MPFPKDFFLDPSAPINIVLDESYYALQCASRSIVKSTGNR